MELLTIPPCYTGTKVIAHRDTDASSEGVRGHQLPIVFDGNDLFIPTTSLAMDDNLVRSLRELVEILIPTLKARTAAFIKKYLPKRVAPGAYFLSLEDDPVEWLVKTAQQ